MTLDTSKPGPIRTAFDVRRGSAELQEIIRGSRQAWRFRLHFHAGIERVRLTSGRARLRLRDECLLLQEGDCVEIPAGVVHRFEAVDEAGWAFESTFQLEPGPASERGQGSLHARVVALLAQRRSLRSDVAGLARECALSSGYLARRFRQETGSSLHNFHVLLALQKSKALLRGGASLVEAALAAGFFDQPHLTREFVGTYGMTPGAYQAAWAA